MIKLVACDLDGTLFNSEMAVSAANAKAVKNAQSSGIEFLIATGRHANHVQFSKMLICIPVLSILMVPWFLTKMSN